MFSLKSGSWKTTQAQLESHLFPIERGGEFIGTGPYTSKWWQSLIPNLGFTRSHLQRLKVGDMVSSQRIVKTNPLKTINYKALDGCGSGGGRR
ncbi:hypothetical protein NL676_023491 [Syzygium grande]|nr:hypothetical protein NL676_023491 [Syzygium grande]